MLNINVLQFWHGDCKAECIFNTYAMKAKHTFFILMMFLGALNLVKAQDTTAMDLKACMRYAVEHSTKIRIQQADNRDAQIDRRDAILATFTPEISGSTYAYANFGRSIDPETNTYIRTTSFHNGYSLSGGIVLFNGFQAVNNLRITQTAQQMGFTKEQQLEDQICLATMEAYCNVLYYTELEKALQAQVATAEKSVQLAMRQEELGQKSHADVVQMQSDLAERQYQLTTCRNNLNNAMITLKDVMFWPIETPLKIDESFSRLPQCDSPTNETAVTPWQPNRRNFTNGGICQNQHAIRPFGRGHNEERPSRPEDGPLATDAHAVALWRLVVEFLHLSWHGRLCAHSLFRPVEEQRR